MPIMQYLIWRDQIKMARQSGWTIQERYFNNFFRGHKNIYFHAYSQAIHPFGYIERQRGDNFLRRMQTLIPGIEAPEWAYNQKRTPDFDFESLLNITNAYQPIHAEATPKPHYNSSDWNNIAHIFNQRFQGGYYAQRLFFNEEIRGDKYTLGPYGEVDKNLLNSWYANSDNSYLWKMQNYNQDQVKTIKKNAEKWIKLIDEHYPEFKEVKCEGVKHKFNEPHFERNVSDIRRTILSEKWLYSLESDKFSSDEVGQIKKFFLGDSLDNFFEEDLNGKIYQTELMKKLNEVIGLPCVFKLDRFTGEIPEHQYSRYLDEEFGINFYIVNSYKKNLVSMTNNEDFRKLCSSVKGFSLRALVSEEVYNPLFKRRLLKNFGSNSQNGSFVVDILNKDPKQLNNLIQIFFLTREELEIFSSKSYNRFLGKIRQVVSTFNFVPK